LLGFERVGAIDEVVEAAAEAGAGDLLDGHPLRAQAVGVHEVGGLVVGDQADLLAAAHVIAREAAQGRRLTRAEEAADHHEANLGHGSWSLEVNRRDKPGGLCIHFSRLVQSLNGYDTLRSGVYLWTVIQENSRLLPAGSG